MAKRKKATQIPATPPQDVADVMIDHALQECTQPLVEAYAGGMMFGPKGRTDKQREQFTKAVLTFSALGWAYYTKRRINGEA